MLLAQRHQRILAIDAREQGKDALLVANVVAADVKQAVEQVGVGGPPVVLAVLDRNSVSEQASAPIGTGQALPADSQRETSSAAGQRQHRLDHPHHGSHQRL
jgi:hypothetical protein